MALRSMLGLTQPHTFELASQRMATVMTGESEERDTSTAVGVLYRSVNAVRKDVPFPLEPLRVRWVTDEAVPKAHRGAMWGLHVPAGVSEVPSVDDRYPVRIEIWEYGTVAEILHEGSRAEELRALERLRVYMREQRLEPMGSMEEEYLSPPGAPIPKTLIRYRVKPG